jgi:hypothetical protein
MSIAARRFANLSGDSSQNYFADGIVETSSTNRQKAHIPRPLLFVRFGGRVQLVDATPSNLAR